MSKNTIIKGAFILTITGFLTRVIGFFFRIFLSHSFGEEQMGLYQLIFPIYALCFSLSCAGIETALCRLVASKTASGKSKEATTLLYKALAISVLISLALTFILRKNATVFSLSSGIGTPSPQTIGASRESVGSLPNLAIVLHR